MIKTRRSTGSKIVVDSNNKTKLPKERPVNETKYIGMDVHMATTVIAVRNSVGKVVAESIVETKASVIVDFLKGQRGALYVTFEEGTQASWLYDLIRPHAAEVVVCDPRQIAGQESKSDKTDAKRLAELLRTNSLKPIYHGEHRVQALKELAHSYGSIIHDGTRVKNRLKALFRGRGIACQGTGVYSKKERDEWLKRLDNGALRLRIQRLWKELDLLTELRQEAEKDLMVEARRHPESKILRSIPGIGPMRAAVILAFAITPYRFRTRKQFWNYCGLGLRSKITPEYELVQGRVRRSKKRPLLRGLNPNYNRALKDAFKGAAVTAALGPWKSQFDAMVEKGMRAPVALVTLARKIAAISLVLWKKGERYNKSKVKFGHAA
jgi:transposase